jgi:arylsulfatase A-like enzyme
LQQATTESSKAKTNRSVSVPTSGVFWPCFWLAVVLCAAKSFHGGDPSSEEIETFRGRLVNLAIFVHQDLIVVLVFGFVWSALIWLSRRRERMARMIWWGGLLLCAASALYAVVSVPIFEQLGTPLTYPLLHVAGDFGNMRSSLAEYLTVRLALAMVLVPAALVVVSWTCNRFVPLSNVWVRSAVVVVCVGAVVANTIFVRQRFERWSDRDDRAIAQNAQWVLIASTAEALVHPDSAVLHENYPPEFAAEFQPARRLSATTAPAGARMNVSVIVLESVAAKYLSVYGSPYDATPVLRTEARNALVVENVYSHVGMTANSLVSMLLGVYPPITWRQLTRDDPDYPGVSLAQVMHGAGYRTAYITSADLGYVSTDRFLAHRGFDRIDDVNTMGVEYAFSWGCADRYMVDGLLKWMDEDPKRPFFAMTWTQQTHHPYGESPDQPEIDFSSTMGRSLDDYHLNLYLNALHEGDRQIGRLIEALRQRKLDEQTIIIIVGDHGEAFGWPHPFFGHGSRVFEENLHVPFVVWCPALFAGGKRSPAVGGLVDLGPTVLDLCGLAPPAPWQGTSLVSPTHPPRAYFAAANDGYFLALREGHWKYIYNATLGREELFDLPNDPHELTNVASANPRFCHTSRQHLAAWLDSYKNRRR